MAAELGHPGLERQPAVRRLGFWNSFAMRPADSGGSACRRVATNSVLSRAGVEDAPDLVADRSAT
jgi:hypothetical protein